MPVGPKAAVGEISGEHATLLATIWARQIGMMYNPLLSESRGVATDIRETSPCGRPLYARSPFALPTELPAPHRREFGSWWLITFCDAGSVPSVSIAVSALATELTVTDGRIRFPFLSGNEFVPMGVPVGHQGEFPMSPESAVALIHGATGRRAAGAPELIAMTADAGTPHAARWRIPLDTAAAVVTGTEKREVRAIFVGVLPGKRAVTSFFVPVPGGAEHEVSWNPPPAPGEHISQYESRISADHRTTTVRSLPGYPTRFAQVSNIGGH